jgi:CheY-like chemotaxis protein/tetratricopeptide (TPR) repeat protein
MGLKILIVEDDRHVRRILETLFVRDPEFAALEPKVLLASDGAEGLKLLRAERPDVVITDLLMPNMDGFQFCRAVRDDADAGGCTLIVMSAVYKDPGLIAKLKAEMGVEFFAKPFQVRDLVRTVRRRLQEAQSAARRAAENAVPVWVSQSPSTASQSAAPMIETQRGSLVHRPVPRLLLDCHETQATGTLTIRRGGAQKDIFLLVGHPIGVDSTLRSETLGVYLVQRRILDEKQVRAALAVTRQQNIKFGQALVQSGLLTEEEVLETLQAQVRYKLMTSLRWPDGEYQFVPGDTFSDRMTKSTVDPVRVVFVGLKRTARLELIQGRLAGDERVVSTARILRYAEPWRRVFGRTVFERLRDQPTVEALLAELPPVEVLPQVDALSLCGMARLEAPPGRVAGRTPAPTPDPFVLGDLERQSTGATEPSAIQPLDELFGGEVSRVGPPSAPHRRLPELIYETSTAALADAGDAPARERSGPHVEPAEELASAAPPPDPQVDQIRRRVAQIYLTLHDADFYQLLGISRAATFDQIADAFTSLAREFRLEQFAPYDLGRDYTRLEELNIVLRKAFETLSDPIKRLEYDRAHAPQGPPRDDPFEAELLFRQGEERLSAGDGDGAVPLLEQAVARRPNYAEYHALLGWARISAGGSEARTRAAADIARALAMEPELAAGHEYAGRLALVAGDVERAFDHLERSLDSDPLRQSALGAYEEACAAQAAWRRLERQYRKLIHRVGERDADLTLRLWWRLGDCYRERLEDPNSARLAYEVAARYAPDEPRLQEALVTITAGDPERWRDTARALRKRWRLAPSDPSELRQLYAMHAAANRRDAALLAAQALVSRDAADNGQQELYYRHRPRAAFLLNPPLERASWNRLAHPEDDPEIGALFALLAPVVSQVWPVAVVDIGADPAARIDDPPAGFRLILNHACGLLGLPVPELYLRDDFGPELHAAGTNPAILLVGRDALAADDPVSLTARTARAATYLLPGRATGGSQPTRTLKTYLLAAMTLAAPGLRVEDEDGAIAELRAALNREPEELQRRVRELVERVTRQKAVVNLSRWSRALARSADRFALLACADLVIAAQIAREAGSAGADLELIEFALSDEHLQLRQTLKLALE